jgi:6-phosphogluconate dehydrogenase (decarboxylating)
MEVGYIGARVELALRIEAAGMRVVACGVETANSLPNAVAVARALSAPRIVCLDLGDGFATELAIQDVWPECAPGDVVVDFGGGEQGDGRRRADALASVRMHFVDAHAHRDGDGLLVRVGGHADAIRAVAALFDALCGKMRWTHGGPPGSGYHAAMNGPSSAGLEP